MTEQNKTKVPAELIPAGDYPVVSTDAVMDKQKGKTQEEVNEQVDADVEALQQADTNLQEQITAEASRASAKENSLDNRLSTVEELAEISVEGGTIGIASSEDFTNRTPAGDAKIPTVGAIMGSVDEEPTPNSDNLVKSGGVANNFAKASDLLTVQGSYYSANTGAFVQNIDIVCSTPKIPVNGAISGYVYLGGSTYPQYGFSFFDDNGFISGYFGTESGMQNVDVSIPSGAKYFSYCCPKTRKDSIYILCGIDGTLVKEVGERLKNSDVISLDYQVFKTGTVTYNLPSVYIEALYIVNNKGDIAKTITVDNTYTFSTNNFTQAIYYNPANDEVTCQGLTNALCKEQITLLIYKSGQIIGGILYSDYIKCRTNSENDFLVSQEVLGFAKMRTLDGFDLESTYTNLKSTSKLLVVKVNGGETINVKRNDSYPSIIAILKEFDISKDTGTTFTDMRATGESSNWTISAVDYLYGKKLPSDAKYLLIRYINGSGGNFLPKYFTIDGYNITKSLRENVYNTLTDTINASTLRSTEGYYRVTTPYNFSPVAGFKATEPIPVYVGDVITTNSNFNSPYTAAGNCVMDVNKEIIGALEVSDGIAVITQEMWDSGVRYIGISFRDSLMTETPSVTIKRNKISSNDAIITELSSKTAQNTSDIDKLNLRNKIVVKKNNDSIFNIVVYDNNGQQTRYSFVKYYKKWDSLDYTDGDGQTQQATDVISANVWSNNNVYKGDTQIVQGNTNFIFQETNGGYHNGDQHGLEVSQYTCFLVDGKEWNPSTGDDNLVCQSFRFINRAFVYQRNGGENVYTGAIPALDNSGNPIPRFIHYLDAEFKSDNVVDIDNRLTILANGISFEHLNGAMLECYFGKFSVVSVNNNENTINSVSDAGVFGLLGGCEKLLSTSIANTRVDEWGNKVEMYGKGFYVLQDIQSNYSDECLVDFFTYADRLKCYFQPAHVSNKPTGQTARVFNSGDSINCKCHREIKLGVN